MEDVRREFLEGARPGPRPKAAAFQGLRFSERSAPRQPDRGALEPVPSRAQLPRAAVVRATRRSSSRRTPAVLNGRCRGRKWKGPLGRTRRGGQARRVFIEERTR